MVSWAAWYGGSLLVVSCVVVVSGWLWGAGAGLLVLDCWRWGTRGGLLTVGLLGCRWCAAGGELRGGGGLLVMGCWCDR